MDLLLLFCLWLGYPVPFHHLLKRLCPLVSDTFPKGGWNCVDHWIADGDCIESVACFQKCSHFHTIQSIHEHGIHEPFYFLVSFFLDFPMSSFLFFGLL